MWRNLEPLCTVGGTVKWCNHYDKHCKVSSKKELPYDPAIPFEYIVDP